MHGRILKKRHQYKCRYNITASGDNDLYVSPDPLELPSLITHASCADKKFDVCCSDAIPVYAQLLYGAADHSYVADVFTKCFVDANPAGLLFDVAHTYCPVSVLADRASVVAFPTTHIDNSSSELSKTDMYNYFSLFEI